MLSQQKRYWAEISLDAAENNFNVIKEKLGGKSKLCCAVKADAYGHGAPFISKFYEELGVDYLAVSNIEEAIELRNNGINVPILLLGYTPTDCVKILADNNFEQCVFSSEFAESLNEEAEKHGVKIKIHIKIDTGMGRLGFCVKNDSCDQILETIFNVCNLKNLIPHGIFTHFAIADEERGIAYTKKQFENFQYAIKYLEKKGIDFKFKHCSNSAAIFDYPEFKLDMVRAGVMLYGVSPACDISSYGLLPLMSLKSIITQIKTVEKGDCISYGCTFKAEKRTRIATIPVGYADGLTRSYKDNGEIIVNGKKYPIAGRICMDQLMIDIGDNEDIKAGDIVTIMGRDNGAEISAEDIAEKVGTITYEIICSVSKRVPRVYIKNDKIIHISDDIID